MKEFIISKRWQDFSLKDTKKLAITVRPEVPTLTKHIEITTVLVAEHLYNRVKNNFSTVFKRVTFTEVGALKIISSNKSLIETPVRIHQCHLHVYQCQ